jgi:hypothetical protein
MKRIKLNKSRSPVESLYIPKTNILLYATVSLRLMHIATYLGVISAAVDQRLVYLYGPTTNIFSYKPATLLLPES